MFAVEDVPAITQGHDVAGLVCGAAPQTGDIVVIAQKIISKAEGRIVKLSSVEVSDDAHAAAQQTGKDPRSLNWYCANLPASYALNQD